VFRLNCSQDRASAGLTTAKRSGYQSNEACYVLGARLRAVAVMTEGGDPWMYGLAPCAHECSKDEPKKPCPACDWQADLYTRKADLGSMFKIRPFGYRKPRSLFPATVIGFPKSKKKRKLLLRKQLRYCVEQMRWRWVLKTQKKRNSRAKDQGLI
jgi:hypothetical protein